MRVLNWMWGCSPHKRDCNAIGPFKPLKPHLDLEEVRGTKLIDSR